MSAFFMAEHFQKLFQDLRLIFSLICEKLTDVQNIIPDEGGADAVYGIPCGGEACSLYIRKYGIRRKLTGTGARRI